MTGVPAFIAAAVTAARSSRSGSATTQAPGCSGTSPATTSASNSRPAANLRSSNGDTGSGSHGLIRPHCARTGHCLAR